MKKINRLVFLIFLLYCLVDSSFAEAGLLPFKRAVASRTLRSAVSAKKAPSVKKSAIKKSKAAIARNAFHQKRRLNYATDVRHKKLIAGKRLVAKYDNTLQKGTIGDAATARKMTGKGYKKLPSKINGNQGIDGIYVKNNLDGSVHEIIVVENKVDKSQLNRGTENRAPQMSEQWVENNIDKMLGSPDPETRKTAQLLRENADKVKYQLHHHTLPTDLSPEAPGGITKVYELDKNGNKVKLLYEEKGNTLKDLAKNGCGKKYTCTEES